MMFKVFDKDGDDHISMEEFEFYLPSSKWRNVIIEVFGDEKKDIDADLIKISKDEFINVMNKYGKDFFALSAISN